MNYVWIEVEGQRVKVAAEKVAGQLWFHYQGETFNYEPARQRRGGGVSLSSHPGLIKAPMPGKIMKVLIAAGESVEVGRPLVMMEAMKMEYTLAADLNGEVKTISCREGDQVSAGQTLIEIEEEDGDAE